MKGLGIKMSVFVMLIMLYGTSCRQKSNSSDLGDFICAPCGSACDKMIFKEAGKCPHCGMALIPQETSVQNGQKNVAILIFDGVEILDFGGPAEVFASAGAYHVYTVAASKSPIMSQGFIKIQPEYSIDDCPKPDIIVLPGGNMMAPLENPKIIDWVKFNEPHLETLLSVCTGAFILDKAGLLEGKKATTFHNAIEELRKMATKTEVLDNVRWVDNGKIITTAGVSAGMDGSLRVIDRSLGREKALSTVKYMEYDKWNPDQGMIVDSTLNPKKQ